ncbi:MAG: 2-hydroxyacyl-CoA dehydratase family protein [Dehalococcoidia bacterium]
MAGQNDILQKLSDNFGVIRQLLAGESAEVSVFDYLGPYFDKVNETTASGEKLAWINFGVMPELFWAMDITPIVVDSLTGAISGLGEAMKYIDIAEEQIPDYLCANNKILLGAALAGDIDLPCIMVHPSHPCDSNIATYPHIAEYFGFPYYLIDMPYFRNERSAKYTARELGNLIPVLENLTGRKLDFDKLQEVMKLSNQAQEYVLKLNHLRQQVPSPYPSLDMITEYGLLMNLAGTPELVDYLKRKYEWAKAKVDKGEGHLEEEKYRLVWIYGAVTFDMGIFNWLEREYGAVSVSHMNNNWTMDPVKDITTLDGILEGWARKIELLPMTRECGGPWENYLNAAMDLCRNYKADGAIFAGHIACKSNWAIAKMVKDRIQDEAGVPVLNLQLDLFDPRITSTETIMGILDNFMNTVMENKKTRTGD